VIGSTEALGIDMSSKNIEDKAARSNGAGKRQVKLNVILRYAAKTTTLASVCEKHWMSCSAHGTVFQEQENKATGPESQKGTRSEEKKAAQQSCCIIGPSLRV
jgi:hypothetical protein